MSSSRTTSRDSGDVGPTGRRYSLVVPSMVPHRIILRLLVDLWCLVVSWSTRAMILCEVLSSMVSMYSTILQ